MSSDLRQFLKSQLEVCEGVAGIQKSKKKNELNVKVWRESMCKIKKHGSITDSTCREYCAVFSEALYWAHKYEAGFEAIRPVLTSKDGT